MPLAKSLAQNTPENRICSQERTNGIFPTPFHTCWVQYIVQYSYDNHRKIITVSCTQRTYSAVDKGGGLGGQIPHWLFITFGKEFWEVGWFSNLPSPFSFSFFDPPLAEIVSTSTHVPSMYYSTITILFVITYIMGKTYVIIICV